MKPIEELQKIFAAKINHQQRLIFSCGSGGTACILALAAELAGYSKITVYDGSWSEWGLESSSRPVAINGLRAGQPKFTKKLSNAQ